MDMAKIISEQVSDTRELEGSLLSIYARSALLGREIGIETVEEFFSKKQNNGVKKITTSEVIRSICSYYNIRQSHLRGIGRTENVALPRQVAMYLLRKELGLKYEEIAYVLKKKDHTTIMYGVEKISSLMIKDVVFKQEVDRIVSSLKQST